MANGNTRDERPMGNRGQQGGNNETRARQHGGDRGAGEQARQGGTRPDDRGNVANRGRENPGKSSDHQQRRSDKD
jgi:hypothetical protein